MNSGEKNTTVTVSYVEDLWIWAKSKEKNTQLMTGLLQTY